MFTFKVEFQSYCLYMIYCIKNYNPDVLCIAESWLYKDVLGVEIQMPGYVTLRQGRNLEYFDNVFTQESRGGCFGM